MGINERLRDVEVDQATQKENLRLLSVAVDKVCGAMETAMEIQTKQGVHLGLIAKIVYGAVALACLAVGGATIDLVVRSHVSAADRVDKAPDVNYKIP